MSETSLHCQRVEDNLKSGGKVTASLGLGRGGKVKVLIALLHGLARKADKKTAQRTSARFIPFGECVQLQSGAAEPLD